MIPTRHRYDFCSACALSRQNPRSWKFSGTRRSRDTERKANNFGPTWGSHSLMIQEFINGHALPTEQRVGQDAPTGRCHILAILAYRLPSGFQTNLIIWSTQETQRCEIKGDAYRNCSMISAPAIGASSGRQVRSRKDILLVHFLPSLVGIVFGDCARQLCGFEPKVLLNDDTVLVDHECHHSRSSILGRISQKCESFSHFAID